MINRFGTQVDKHTPIPTLPISRCIGKHRYELLYIQREGENEEKEHHINQTLLRIIERVCYVETFLSVMTPPYIYS